jgi:ferredoxin-thioredoxin reductase catalytic subunit/rubredoxin
MTARNAAALQLYERLKREASEAGYYLNPDVEFTLDLMEGLVANQERYGYPSCPCRLAEGERQADLDIICPCDYRDPDLDEHGACYCGLYVSEDIFQGRKKARSIPERRRTGVSEAPHAEELVGFTAGGIPVWRCKVCGYLCARPQPPLKCPICKADRDRFERFAFGKAS